MALHMHTYSLTKAVNDIISVELKEGHKLCYICKNKASDGVICVLFNKCHKWRYSCKV